MDPTSFDGLLFDERSAPGGDVVQVSVEEQGLGAVRFDGKRELFLASTVSVDWSGISGEPVGFRDGPKRVLFVNNPQVLAAVGALGVGELARRARQLASRGRRWAQIWVAAGVLVAMLLLGVVYTAIAGGSALVDAVVARVPPSWEQSLGDLAMGQMKDGKTEVTDAAVIAPLARITTRLVESLGPTPYRFTFHVLADGSVNAFALPGGQVAVFTGLLTAARSADEVAGVLAHEIQHVVCRHGVRDLIERVGLGVGLGLLLGSHETARDCAGLLLNTRFSRVQEAQADALGAELLLEAGLSVEGMATFFDRLAEEQGGSERVAAFISDHPVSRDRARAIRRVASDRAVRPPPRPLDLNWQTYTQAVKQLSPPKPTP